MAYLIGIAILLLVYAIGGGWWLFGVLAVLVVTGWTQTRWENSLPPDHPYLRKHFR